MGIPWQPKSDHVSQLQFNPTTGGVDGREDCGPSALLRALREYGKLPANADVASQLNALRILIDGVPDEPGQGGTNTTDLEKVLTRYGIPGQWSNDFAAAENATMAIVLVNNPPSPAQYPQSWLGGQSHWILWLPNWNGAINWWNDPLAWNNGQKDCQYDLASVRGVFEGAILLPPFPVAKLTIAKACAIKVRSNHQCSGLGQLAVGAIVTDDGQVVTTDDEWHLVTADSGKTGWIPKASIKQAA